MTEKKERLRKRKLDYVSDLKRRFQVERDRFMLRNEILTVFEFEDLLGFERRYMNGIINKADRGIPSWVFPHIDFMNKKLIKQSENGYYSFNVNYVITGDLEPVTTKQEKEKRIQAERELLIMQGRYEEATKKAQGNS